MWTEQTCFSQFLNKCCSEDGKETKIGCVRRDKGKRRRWRATADSSVWGKLTPEPAVGAGNKLTHAAELWEDSRRYELWGFWENENLGMTLKQNEMEVYFPQLEPFPRTPGNSPTVQHSSRLGRSARAALWIRGSSHSWSTALKWWGHSLTHHKQASHTRIQLHSKQWNAIHISEFSVPICYYCWGQGYCIRGHAWKPDSGAVGMW